MNVKESKKREREREREPEWLLRVRERMKTGIPNQICLLIGRFGRFF